MEGPNADSGSKATGAEGSSQLG